MENNPAQPNINQPQSIIPDPSRPVIPTSPDLSAQKQTKGEPNSPSGNPLKPASKFSLKAIIGTIIFLLLAGSVAAGFVYREQLFLLFQKPQTLNNSQTDVVLNEPDNQDLSFEKDEVYSNIKRRIIETLE